MAWQRGVYHSIFVFFRSLNLLSLFLYLLVSASNGILHLFPLEQPYASRFFTCSIDSLHWRFILFFYPDDDDARSLYGEDKHIYEEKKDIYTYL